MLPNHFHCPLSTGGRQITMPMHRYKPQAESPEAKCPRFALIRCRMRSRALRKLQTHTIAPKGHRKGQVRSHLIVDVLCHPNSALKARARANGNGVEVGGQGERSKPWGAGIVIRKHYLRLSLVCGSIAWAAVDETRIVAKALRVKRPSGDGKQDSRDGRETITDIRKKARTTSRERKEPRI